MKSFHDIKISPPLCKKEIGELAALLSANPQLRERDHLLPFFQQRRHLSAFIGTLIPKMYPNRIAYEYELFGDFRADLVVGDTDTNVYVFVEFQTGVDRIFRKKASKHTSEWSSEFEAGFSQLIDWFWALDCMKQTPQYKANFHPNNDEPPVIWPMLIGCRGNDLGYYEKVRLKWRTDKVLIDSRMVFSLTYDLLCQQLDDRIKLELSYWSRT